MAESGVLNSWETLLMKSLRKVSIPASSWVIRLKLWAMALTSAMMLCSETFTSKFPRATFCAASLISRMGRTIFRIHTLERMVLTARLMSAKMIRSGFGPLAVRMPEWMRKIVAALSTRRVKNMMTKIIREKKTMIFSFPFFIAFSPPYIRVPAR